MKKYVVVIESDAEPNLREFETEFRRAFPNANLQGYEMVQPPQSSIGSTALSVATPVVAVAPTPVRRSGTFVDGAAVRIISHRRKPQLIGQTGSVVSSRMAHGKRLYSLKLASGDVMRDIAGTSLLAV